LTNIGSNTEYRAVRMEREYKKMGFSKVQRGELLERFIGIEVEASIDGVKFAKGHVQTPEGTVNTEFDCIIYDSKAFPDEVGTKRIVEVPIEYIICAIEVRTFVSKSHLEDPINHHIRERQNIGSFPIFLIGIQHRNPIGEIRKKSIADETVVCGTLNTTKYKWGRSASEMVDGHEGEFDRLLDAVHQSKARYQRPI